MINLLTFERVTFRYAKDDLAVLDQLSFSVAEGRFACLLGPSGCGKSTVLRLINGLETPEEGKIQFNGLDMTAKHNLAAFMPQKDLLFPWYTIEENLCLPMSIQKIPVLEQKARCQQILEEIGLRDAAKKYPSQLSGGMRQRAAFGRTLLTGAKLLLLDEPFGALDYLTRITMQEWLLTQWEKFGATILFITHDVEEAIFLSQEVYTMPKRSSKILQKTTVPFPYPRRRELLQQAEVCGIRERVIHFLGGEESDEEK